MMYVPATITYGSRLNRLAGRRSTVSGSPRSWSSCRRGPTTMNTDGSSRNASMTLKYRLSRLAGVSELTTPWNTIPPMAGTAAARVTGAFPLRTSLLAANAAAISSALPTRTSTSWPMPWRVKLGVTVTVQAKTAAATSTVAESSQNRSRSRTDRAASG